MLAAHETSASLGPLPVSTEREHEGERTLESSSGDTLRTSIRAFLFAVGVFDIPILSDKLAPYLYRNHFG